MLIDFNFSSISWTIFYLRVGSQMVCFPDRFWSDALADLTNICLFAFGLLATSRYYIVHVLASACAVEGCAEARSVAAPKESAPTSGLTFSPSPRTRQWQGLRQGNFKLQGVTFFKFTDKNMMESLASTYSSCFSPGIASAPRACHVLSWSLNTHDDTHNPCA